MDELTRRSLQKLDEACRERRQGVVGNKRYTFKAYETRGNKVLIDISVEDKPGSRANQNDIQTIERDLAVLPAFIDRAFAKFDIQESHDIINLEDTEPYVRKIGGRKADKSITATVWTLGGAPDRIVFTEAATKVLVKMNKGGMYGVRFGKDGVIILVMNDPNGLHVNNRTKNRLGLKCTGFKEKVVAYSYKVAIREIDVQTCVILTPDKTWKKG